MIETTVKRGRGRPKGSGSKTQRNLATATKIKIPVPVIDPKEYKIGLMKSLNWFNVEKED